MSRRRVARRSRAPSAPPGPSAEALAAQDAVEAIALRVRQIASVAGVVARGMVDDEDVGHVLYLIEETLLDVERRVERLRRVPP